MRNLKRTLVALFIASLVGVGIGVAQPADADSFGICPWNSSGNTGCLTDDRNVDYCTVYPWPVDAYGSLFGLQMANLNNQSNPLYQTYSPTCGTQTDIGGYIAVSPEFPSGLPAGVIAASLCTKLTAGKATTCDQSTLILGSALAGKSSAVKRHSLCHEIGHIVGLTHGSTYGGCMTSGLLTLTTYAGHHVTHLNTY